MKAFRLLPLLLAAALLPAPAAATQDYPAVRDAAASVYRLWLGMPLPREFTLRNGTTYLPKLDTQGYALVPLDGLYLNGEADGKDGKNAKKSAPQALKGQGIVFRYGGRNYLLLATGSAYAVSDKGHLLTRAPFAAGGGTEVIYADPSGMRHLGEGKTQAFAVGGVHPQLKLFPTDTKVLDGKTGLAALQADNLKTKAVPLADPRFTEPATAVFALGMEGTAEPLNPKQSEQAADDIRSKDYLQALTAEGLLQRKIRRGRADVFEHSAGFSGSQSGGALLNSCGQAVGVNLNGTDSDNTFTAVAATEAAHLLQSHNIPFKQIHGRCGGAATAVANVTEDVVEAAVTAVRKPQQSLQVGGLLLLAVVAALVAWKLLKWVWRQKRRPAAAPANTPTRRHHADNGSGAVLHTLSGHNGDIRVPEGRPVIIGRDGRSDIVIRHAEISSAHLKLSFDGRSLYTEDLGSTNGSYVNGARIHGRTALHDGDTLHLTADPAAASFRVGAAAAAAPRTRIQHAATAVLRPLNGGLPEIRIGSGSSVRIGRAEGNDIRLSHPQVSGEHCRLELQSDGSLYLHDNGSTNGTFVGDLNQRVHGSIRLHNGQTVYFANAETAYRVEQG